MTFLRPFSTFRPHNLQQALANTEQHVRVPTLAGSMAQEASGSASCPDSEGGCAEKFRSEIQSWGASLGLSPSVLSNATTQYQATAEFEHDWGFALDSVISDIRVVCGCLDNARRLAANCGAGIKPAACDVWQYVQVYIFFFYLTRFFRFPSPILLAS